MVIWITTQVMAIAPVPCWHAANIFPKEFKEAELEEEFDFPALFPLGRGINSFCLYLSVVCSQKISIINTQEVSELGL